MSHVFISYKHTDEDFITLLQEELDNVGIAAWTDKALLAGEDWKEGIDTAIRNAFALIVVMTPDARLSEYVTYEWSFAWGVGVKVIPLMLEQTAMHPRLDSLQYLNFTNPDKRPWKALFKRLHQLQSTTLIKQLTSNSWLTRSHAAHALGNLKARDAVSHLADIMQRDRSKRVRLAAEEALEKIGTPEARTAIDEYWENGE